MEWLLEAGVFGSGFDLAEAARGAGHRVTRWDDAWGGPGGWVGPTPSEPVVFHGSLANAARIAQERPWRPGSWCDVAAFRCSTWYPRAARWLLNEDWRASSARDLVEAPPAWDAMFVRPDSPLKPFSGRVVRRAGLTLAALDFGFYFDDPALPVVVAPVRPVEREWRYVVVDGRVVAGSGYEADGRRPRPDDPGGAPWRFAAEVAEALEPPQAVYVLDVGLAAGALRLVELNPFSDADLYACDPAAVVRAVAAREPVLFL
jgi:hypothetical protein